MTEHIVPGHLVERTLIEKVWYEPHGQRYASPEYKRVHKHLVWDLDEACWICGIRQSQQPAGVYNETHHWWIEWALANSVDSSLVRTQFDPDRVCAAASDDVWLRQWLDSEGNMLVLCPLHHRQGLSGIHMITYPIWVAQRFKGDHDITKEVK